MDEVATTKIDWKDAEQRRQYNRAYWQKNKVRAKLNQKKHRAKYLERYQKKCLAYYYAHREVIQARCKRYRAEHREEIIASHREWRRKRNEWYNALRTDIQRGKSIKTLPAKEQERFWKMFDSRIKKQVPASTLTIKDKALWQ